MSGDHWLYTLSRITAIAHDRYTVQEPRKKGTVAPPRAPKPAFYCATTEQVSPPCRPVGNPSDPAPVLAHALNHDHVPGVHVVFEALPDDVRYGDGVAVGGLIDERLDQPLARPDQMPASHGDWAGYMSFNSTIWDAYR